MAKKMITLNGTATGTEASVAVNVTEIKLISNDHASQTLTLGFDNATTGTVSVVLKAGESMENLPVGVTTLYYKGSGAGTSFRFYGLA